MLRARMHREQDGKVEGRRGLQDASEAIDIVSVFGAMKSKEIVSLALQVELLEGFVSALLGERGILQQRVVHDIAYHGGAAFARVAVGADALAVQVLHGGTGWREQELAEVIGHDAILLFGHSGVLAAAAGFHMGQGKFQARGEQCAGQRRIRVAVNDDPIDALGGQDGLHAREHAGELRTVGAGADREVVRWLRNSHLREEEIGDFMIVMLAGVYDAVVDAWSAPLFVVGLDGAANRCEFDELRAGAHDAHPSGARAVSFHVS